MQSPLPSLIMEYMTRSQPVPSRTLTALLAVPFTSKWPLLDVLQLFPWLTLITQIWVGPLSEW